MAAAALGCHLAALDPPPARHLPTLSDHLGAVLLVEAHGVRLWEDCARPFRWHQKICANLQFELLRLEGIVKLNPPDDWQTKQAHVRIVTEAGANSQRLAEFLQWKGFTEFKDSRHEELLNRGVSGVCQWVSVLPAIAGSRRSRKSKWRCPDTRNSSNGPTVWAKRFAVRSTIRGAGMNLVLPSLTWHLALRAHPGAPRRLGLT